MRIQLLTVGVQRWEQALAAEAASVTPDMGDGDIEPFATMVEVRHYDLFDRPPK